jgi:hypothetical protein
MYVSRALEVALIVVCTMSCTTDETPPYASRDDPDSSDSEPLDASTKAPATDASDTRKPEAGASDGSSSERIDAGASTPVADAGGTPELDAGASDLLNPKELLETGLRSGCDVRPADFDACGGDLRGTWTFEGYCYAASFGVIYEHPSETGSGCAWESVYPYPADVATALTVDIIDVWPMNGQLIFGDITVQRSEAVAEVPLVSTFSESCEPVDCAGYGEIFGGGTFGCTGAGTCNCEYLPPSSIPAFDGSYSVNGSTLDIDGENLVSFCVTDSVLRVLEGEGADLRVAIYHRAE